MLDKRGQIELDLEEIEISLLADLGLVAHQGHECKDASRIVICDSILI